MADGRRLIQRLIILVMLVGVNGGIFGSQDSSSSSQEDPAATQFVNMMKKQLKRESSNKQYKTDEQLPSTLVQNFVFRKFKGEMVYMFSFLPVKKCCTILVATSVTTKCNLTAIMHILSNESILKRQKEFKCSAKRTSRYAQCGEQDTTRVLDVFWNQMGRLFDNISVPFQCNIINRIATTSSRYRRQKHHQDIKNRVPRITLQLAEKQLEIIFPFLNTKEKCSKVWKPLKKLVPLQSPASLLNLTVQLQAGIKRKTWLRYFKRKAYQIYKIYYDHFYQSKRQRPLLSKDRTPSNPPLLDDGNVKLAVVRVTKVNGTVSVVFGVEVRKPRTYFYSKISPSKQIIAALKGLGVPALNTFFNATVISLAGAQQESGQSKYFWSMAQIMETKRQFPKYLVAYYRKLDRLGQCLVMLYISSSLQRNLRPVEMLYNTYKYVPRKYFCSSKRRIIVNPIANRTDIYMGKRKLKPKATSIPKYTRPYTTTTTKNVVRIKPRLTNTSKEIGDFPEESEEGPDEKEITPLEIGLFAILALLCVAIFAFTINCILFAIKKKSPQPQQANTVFARAVFRKEYNSKSAGDEQQVQVTLLTDEPNISRTIPRCDHYIDTPSNTSGQCPHNNPVTVGQVTLPREKLSVHSDVNSIDSSSHNDDKNSEDCNTENNHKSNDRIDALEGDNNCSTDCNCSERTNSQHSIHDSSNSISSVVDMNNTDPNQRTLKECSGELKVISDDDNDHTRSACCSSEQDPGIKNSTRKLFVLLDQSSDRETST